MFYPSGILDYSRGENSFIKTKIFEIFESFEFFDFKK